MYTVKGMGSTHSGQSITIFLWLLPYKEEKEVLQVKFPSFFFFPFFIEKNENRTHFL